MEENIFKTLRKEKGLSQKALAEKLYISSQTVVRWESGKYYPDYNTLPQLADVLGVPIARLFGRNEEQSAAALVPADVEVKAGSYPFLSDYFGKVLAFVKKVKKGEDSTQDAAKIYKNTLLAMGYCKAVFS